MPLNASSSDAQNASSLAPPAQCRAQNVPREPVDSESAGDASTAPKRSLLSKFSLLRSSTNLQHRTSASPPSSSSSAFSTGSDATLTPGQAYSARASESEEHGQDGIRVHRRKQSSGGGEKSAPSSPRPKARLRARTGSLRKVALLGGTIKMRADKRTVEGDDGAELTPRASPVVERQASTSLPQQGSSAAASKAAAGSSSRLQTNGDKGAPSGTRGHHSPSSQRHFKARHGDGSGDSEDESDSRGANIPAESSTTTEDEDAARPSSSDFDEPRKQLHPHAPDSYFPPTPLPSPHRPPSLPPPRRHRSSRRARSPLADASVSATSLLAPSLATTTAASAVPTPATPPTADDDEDDDGAATARWGWLLLLGTWVVFVGGVGSCLGVWSWAWDVGATPYAPPELEDDPTLPIVGYYPALAVLTAGVVSWVWVGVAWVGMKYFRHAKVLGEG